jgi:hypothetical protein
VRRTNRDRTQTNTLHTRRCNTLYRVGIRNGALGTRGPRDKTTGRKAVLTQRSRGKRTGGQGDFGTGGQGGLGDREKSEKLNHRENAEDTEEKRQAFLPRKARKTRKKSDKHFTTKNAKDAEGKR